MKLSNQQAIEAQMSLNGLISLKLPVKYSMEIASISSAIDRQVEAFRKVRDSLIKNYQIKVEITDKPGVTKFTTSVKGEDDEETVKKRNDALREFTDKMNELMELDGEDITGKIHLPGDTSVQPDILKSVFPFIELVNE